MAVTISFKYIELFAGIGGFRQALGTLGGECVFASEIDPFATKAYRALYGETSELHGDITAIDAGDIPDHDVLVGGFPCQAFSVAGQRKGFEDTRGTLFFEIARIANVKKPRLILLENVKGLLSHDGGQTFDTMCAALNDIGYAIDFHVLNSKHYGVPQNRERIFIVASREAALDPWVLSKSNDVVTKAKRRATEAGVRTFNFEWPTDGAVTSRLRDVLETNVDEKYYLSDEKTAKLVTQLSGREDLRQVGYVGENVQGNRVYNVDGVGATLAAQTGGLGGKGVSLITESPIIAGSLDHYGNDQMNRVYSIEGVAPTITVVSGGGREQKIAEPCVNDRGTLRLNMGGVSVAVDANYTKGMDKHSQRTHVLEPYTVIQKTHSTCTTVKYNQTGTLQVARLDKVPQAVEGTPRYRIRKLTPLECWRLQGFSDSSHETVKLAGVSDSQRYKQAGNAVTVNVISAIGKRLIVLLPVTINVKEAA
ncbi:DNA (cytosine-5-)-methyltransferase [Paenibacillus sp. NPDC057967]|uniref:DNA (cytosine-5-)-methyltransferase n=1 Tax=Paenibacillus sp. NPDC057967 TaxID=3346293 RepID=UPI0036DF5835